MSSTYRIIRHYQRKSNRVIRSGLTLDEAQAHCRDPETSSSTCTSHNAKRVTNAHGPWFDGCEEERTRPPKAARNALRRIKQWGY